MKTKTGDHRSFIEVLEAELREQIRSELIAELGLPHVASPSRDLPSRDLPSYETVAHEHLQLWLNTNQPAHATGAARPRRARASAYTAYKRATHESHRSPAESPAEPPAEARGQAAQGPAKQAGHATQTQGPEDKTHARRLHELDTIDIVALEFFRRQGAILPENFSEAELKSAYRKIAMRVHPDRHVGTADAERTHWGEIFAELSTHAQRLARHFKAASGRKAA
jgi:hypothetical protein